MSRSRPNLRRRLVAGLTPLALALGALPLLAPTCGGTGGTQTFARSSLIIPMDLCYQSQSDGTSYTPFSCPQAADPGSVIRAYGLVYQLVRNNIAVYWVINPAKGALTDPDLTVQYSAGIPVFLYDWNTGGTGAAPTTASNSITYRGGPFVVDGSDYARASAVLQSYKSLYGSVNVHVSNVAFPANVAKTMAGGWSAGGTVPPKLALLDIGSRSCSPVQTCSGYAKNSEVVIQGYLTQAGLDFGGASGTATGTHGQIYDRLFMEDFLPDASGAVTTTNLFKNGYQILWVPHWFSKGSCSDCASGASCTCRTPYTATQIDLARRTIAAFSAAGKDIFAECAGLGSFEGVPTDASYDAGYDSGPPDNLNTHFQTQAPTGFGINKSVAQAKYWGNFSSPLMQLGDFPFKPLSGAIQNYKASAYKAETVRLVSDATDDTYDVFTFVPSSAAHGTSVYLGGHSYSGTDGPFQIAGSRLVLNTLFNLGAACVESGVACNTGLLGVCSQGVMSCGTTGMPVCSQVTAASPEVCDGLDNDCNGLVDDGLDVACYDGPPSSLDGSGNPRGICQRGVSSCVKSASGTYGMSACQGEVLPSAEVCNGLDDDCNGVVDDAPAPVGSPPNPASSLSQACYTGPSSSLDPTSGIPRGICKAGIATCSGGVWGACATCDDATLPWQSPSSFPGCQILPHTENCLAGPSGQQYDMNCNGIVADGCGCTLGATQSCYTGPSGTLGVGACTAGTQTCVAGSPNNTWGACSGDVVPGPLDCTKPPATPPADANCNAIPDYQEAGCNVCPPAGDPSLACYDGPAGTAGVGVCQGGTRTCSNGVIGTACAGQILPSPEVCDGQDNDCDGSVDDGATCGTGLSCVNGACVPAACGVERPCPEGYACSGGSCVVANCGNTGAPCAAGAVCRFGLCVDPCDGVTCGAGATCASGTCTGGSCYFTGCPSGQLCQNGACAPDACLGVVCPGGTFCRAGDCVQACVFQRCAAGQRCGADGFCVADACAGVACAPDQICEGGSCVANQCLGVGCGQGQVCQDGVCIDDPCNGVTCPAGQCLGGQCYSTENPTGAGAPPAPSSNGGSGCGCGSGAGSASSALLLLLALPLARRRRTPPFRGGALLVLAAAIALVGTGCPKSKGFDPSQCQETCGEQRCVDLRNDPLYCGSCTRACGAGEICVDATCGPAAAVAPYVTSSTPASAPKGAVTTVTLTGERFQAGATLRVIAPAGTQTYAANVTDASHLSADLDFTGSATTSLSLRVVNPDRVISNAFPFDVVTPTPVISDVTPTSITSGQAQALTVTGSGFVASSQCHVKGPSVADQALPTSVTSGTSLDCTFDTAGFSAGAYELWIVNEGTLASNHWTTLSIASSGAPTLTSLSPSAATQNTSVSLLVTGTGFDATSAVTASPPIGITTAPFDPSKPTQLIANFTAPPCATQCDYAITASNSSGVSNALTFSVVQASTYQVSSLSVTPSPLYQGQTATLTFTASGLGATATANVQPPVGAAINGIPATIAAPGASATLNLATACSPSPCPAGLYSTTLTSGGFTSSSFGFRVLSNVALLQSASPAGGAQGTNPTVTLSGSNFQSTPGTILFQGSGVNRSLAPATWSPPTSATVVLDLTGLDTGVYSLAVQNAGAGASNAVSFTVTPGPPALTSVSPSSVPQSSATIPVLVTLTGTNFAKPDANGNAASQVMISPDGGATWMPLPAGNTVTVVSSTRIDVQFDPRTAVPGSYSIQVWNPPGPQKSGSVPFTVTP